MGRSRPREVLRSVKPVEPVGEPPVSTRDKILETAEALFAQRGFAGVGMRQVADRVGVSKSTLFHHFRSKQELYQRVLLRVLERLRERLLPALNSPERPAEKLEVWVEALTEALADHPTTARLLLRGLFEDDGFPEGEDPTTASVEEAIAGVVADFQALLRHGIRDGDFRPVSVEDTTQTLIGATVYHFASGEFGETLLGGPIFSSEAVARRKRELRAFVRRALVATEPEAAAPSGEH